MALTGRSIPAEGQHGIDSSTPCTDSERVGGDPYCW